MKNRLPKEWKEIALGEVLDYEQPTNYIVNSENYSDEYKTPVLTAGKSFILGYTDETNGIYTKFPVIIFDDFTTASHYVNFPFKVKSSAMKFLTPKTKEVNLKYIFWLMQTIKVNSESHKRYYLSKFQYLKIPFPPLPIQQKIVSILEKSEQTKVMRKEADELTKDFLKNIFMEMFGDPVYNDRKWKTKKIDELCALVRGSSPRPKGDPRYYGGNVPRLMISDITRDGRRVTPRNDFLTEEGAKLSRPVKKGTVIMTVSGDVGVTAILNVNACVHDGFVAFNNLNEQEINVEFFEILLNLIKSTHATRKVGAIFQNLTTDQIKNINIPLPPLPLQQKFASIVREVEQMKEQQKHSKEQIDNLFNVLMQKAFKGELVV